MSVVSVLLGSPAVQALIVKMVADVLHELAVRADASGWAVKNAKQLRLVSIVLAVGVTVINLAMAGQLANLNAADVLDKLIEAAAGVLVGGSKLVSGLSRGFSKNVKGLLK